MARVSGAAGLVFLILLTGGPAARGENPPAAPPAPALRIGLAQPMFKDVPKALVDAAATPFQKMIEAKSGVKGTVELCTDYKALADKMRAGKLDICVFHGFEYAWVKDFPELVPLVCTVPNCGKVQACLVVNVSSDAKTPKDLKGACVIVPRGSKAHCFMYLDRLRETVPTGDCCPLKGPALNAEEALGEVAGGSADAAIVDVSALDALKVNFPGAFKQLKILAKSEELPSAVVVYRKGCVNEATAARIRQGLVDCVNTSLGKTFALFWQLKGFEEVSDTYNKLVEKSLKAYPPPPKQDPPAAPPPKP